MAVVSIDLIFSTYFILIAMCVCVNMSFIFSDIRQRMSFEEKTNKTNNNFTNYY